ncbi:MAG: tyrosine-type recombinase/integrase [Kiritimatiellia bacterium]
MSRVERLAAVDLLRLLPTESDRMDVKAAITLFREPGSNTNLAKPLPSPFAEAVRFWLRHHPRGAKMPTLNVALDAYLLKKTSRRPATLREYRDKIGRFQEAFPTATVADITTADIDKWIAKLVSHHRSRRQYLTVLHGFFKFVCRTWHLEINPAAGVYLDAGETDQTEVEAYTVEEVQRIMAAAAKHKNAERIIPVLAIGFFAGLRPSEISGLSWDNVSMDQRQIRVTPATAKRRRQRFVAMSDNLLEWLRPYAKPDGSVAPATITFRRDRAEVFKAAKVDRWLHDGLRHSYGTYHLAAYADANKTANEMGHRGNTDLVYQHYRKLVTQSEGLAYWRVRPAQAESTPESVVEA